MLVAVCMKLVFGTSFSYRDFRGILVRMCLLPVVGCSARCSRGLQSMLVPVFFHKGLPRRPVATSGRPALPFQKAFQALGYISPKLRITNWQLIFQTSGQQLLVFTAALARQRAATSCSRFEGRNFNLQSTKSSDVFRWMLVSWELKTMNDHEVTHSELDSFNCSSRTLKTTCISHAFSGRSF